MIEVLVILQQYYNDKAKPNPFVWDMVESMMAAPAAAVGYGEQGLAVLYALRDYPVVNMTGVVIGSQLPWVEVQALHSGARKVLTVDYQKINVIGSKKIEYIHPIEFANDWRNSVGKYDFAISFSSIEHSGLGRYGDPIDPVGDLREAQKILCLLKRGGVAFIVIKFCFTSYQKGLQFSIVSKHVRNAIFGGIFYLGIPVGRDSIFYNAHRLYGRMRLAMIMTGFEWLATYRGSNPHSQRRTENDYKEYTDKYIDLYVMKRI
ncbi:unnamed protein product [Cylicocyclus nassatus]|uniref:Uncharacterized protein n=1 Tax=Cylicocyclus nassatus TaxID=53992 RepID=A0AA36H8S9_CYLNA|nr:unnamed protein product [Cylicocyclus nassatus]